MRNTIPWNCSTVRERLSDRVRGYLSEAEEDGVEQHLRGCATCREALALERDLIVMAETCAPGAVPHGFAASVLEKRRRQRPLDTFRRALVFRWTACSGLAFRSFVDPLLWAEYSLHNALASRLSAMETALSAVQTRFLSGALKVYQQIAVPLRLACKQVYTPLIGKVLP